MRLLLSIFLLATTLHTIFVVARIIYSFDLIDFQAYYHSSIQFIKSENPYTVSTNNTKFIYPPPTILLLSPLGLFPLKLSQDLWTVFSFTSLITSIYLLIKTITPKVSPTIFLLLLNLSMLIFPVKFTLGLGQINLFILLLLSLTIYSSVKNHQTLSGISLALATSIKLNPIFLIILLFKNKQSKAVKSFFITLFLLTFISFLILGKSVYSEYLFSILPNLPTVGNLSYYNQSLTGFLARIKTPTPIASIIHHSLLLISLTSSFIYIKKTKSPLKFSLNASLLITLSLITGGLAWQHHLTLLIIPLSFLFLATFPTKAKKIKPILLFLLSYFLISYNIKQPDITPLKPILLSHGLLGMFILLYLLITKTRKA